jgi:hypothetical protein
VKKLKLNKYLIIHQEEAFFFCVGSAGGSGISSNTSIALSRSAFTILA